MKVSGLWEFLLAHCNINSQLDFSPKTDSDLHVKIIKKSNQRLKLQWANKNSHRPETSFWGFWGGFGGVDKISEEKKKLLPSYKSTNLEN